MKIRKNDLKQIHELCGAVRLDIKSANVGNKLYCCQGLARGAGVDRAGLAALLRQSPELRCADIGH
jgi:hypothetical protein